MATNLYIAFVGISIAVIVFPGPSILLIVANSLQQGIVAGLYTVAGGAIAMLLQLIIAMVGLTSLVNILARGLDVVRWAGIAYLVYLAMQRWRSNIAGGPVSDQPLENHRSVFFAGFVVALTNPGTMRFFVAVFPQFLNADAPAEPQLLLMAVTFMVLTMFFDTSCALLSARLGRSLRDPRRARIRNRVSGMILLAVAIGLAMFNY